MALVTSRYSCIKSIVFDLDGTVYEGEKLVNGALDSITSLRQHGFGVYFCTNNSTRTRQEIADKLVRLGIETTSTLVFSAGYAAAHYLVNKGFTQVSLLGMPGLKTELIAAGLTVMDRIEQGQALVVGLDQTMTYATMSKFATLLDKNVPVIACNRDRWFPGDNSELMPGCGIMADLVEALLGRGIDFVAGKPNTLLLELLSKQAGIGKDEILVVGDSLDSDIAVAKAYGSQAILYNPRGAADVYESSIVSMHDLTEMILG